MWNISCNHREVTVAGSSQLGALLCVMFSTCVSYFQSIGFDDKFWICVLFFSSMGFENKVIGNQERHNGKT